MKYILLVVLCFIGFSPLYAQPKGEFLKKYKNGRVYQESKKLQVLKGVGFTLNTYYDNGDVMRQEEWAHGKRNGVTKVFLKNNRLLKEARFRDNYLIEYTAFKNGQVYTKVSADRRTIINKGRTITPRWDKYYEVRGTSRILAFDKKQLVDWLCGLMIPEQVTEVMEELSTYFDAENKAAGADDIVSCPSSIGVVNDLGADLTSLASTTSAGKTGSRMTSSPQQQSKRATATAAMGAITNSCASNTRANIGGSGGLGGMNAGRNSKVNKARSTLNNAIAACESGNLGSGGMFAIGPGTGFVSAGALLEEILALEGAAAVEATVVDAVAVEGSAILDATVVNGLVDGAATESGVVLRGFITAGLSEVIVAVGVGAIVGVAVGTLIEQSPVGDAITAGVAAAQEALDEEYQKQAAEAAKAQAAAEEKKRQDENKAKEEAAKADPKGGNKPTTTPVPDGLGSGDACTRMESFKNYCESTNWQDLKCENFVRLVNGCKGDITRMYVAGDGNVMDVSCPGGGSDAEKRAAQAAIDCKKRGLISQPGVGGSNPCRSGNIDRAVPGGNNPLVTDPVRGEFSDAFSNTAVKVISPNELGTALHSAKPTMIVFMDPDCSSCQEFTRSLKDPAMATAYAGMDVKVVDATQSPELLQQYNIQYYPSYFVAKSGKKTDVSIGAMKPADLKKFMTDNANGMK